MSAPATTVDNIVTLYMSSISVSAVLPCTPSYKRMGGNERFVLMKIIVMVLVMAMVLVAGVVGIMMMVIVTPAVVAMVVIMVVLLMVIIFNLPEHHKL